MNCLTCDIEMINNLVETKKDETESHQYVRRVRMFERNALG